MTEITKQLESFTQEELKFIHEVFFEGSKRAQEEADKFKTMSSFMNAIKDLTGAYFPDGESKIIDLTGQEMGNTEEIKEKTAEYLDSLEKAIVQYNTIVAKLNPLIEIIKEK